MGTGPTTANLRSESFHAVFFQHPAGAENPGGAPGQPTGKDLLESDSNLVPRKPSSLSLASITIPRIQHYDSTHTRPLLVRTGRSHNHTRPLMPAFSHSYQSGEISIRADCDPQLKNLTKLRQRACSSSGRRRKLRSFK
ncbi:hypothetical protein HPP92_004689 [Vanilla planifolia]|uniref:Uncharacterized protein n=1 Tax=Vanilla planifolia TaxID=51239 RepID=A0A835VCI0_VANPL|nr:hypothetical protein HPP92_004689 [Vanilla planifolia]